VLPQNPWLDLTGGSSKERQARKDGREGQGKGRREGKGSTGKARGGKGGEKMEGRVSPPHVKTKLRSWSQHREQWRRGKRGGGGRRQVSK